MLKVQNNYTKIIVDKKITHFGVNHALYYGDACLVKGGKDYFSIQSCTKLVASIMTNVSNRCNVYRVVGRIGKILENTCFLMYKKMSKKPRDIVKIKNEYYIYRLYI